MLNIKNIFAKTFQREELGKSKYNGCILGCPGVFLGMGYSHEEIEQLEKESKIKISVPLEKFYSQVKHIELTWEIFEDDEGKRGDDTALFKQDEWLTAHYYKKGYSWAAVKILLSGMLMVPTLEQLLDVNFVKKTGMYDKAKQFGITPGHLLPIDMNEYATACLKVENGVIQDNVYLYTGFGGFPEALHDMKIGFERYLELAYQAKCFNYWNVVYCLKERVPNYELMKRYLPKMYPHIQLDLAEFGIK